MGYNQWWLNLFKSVGNNTHFCCQKLISKQLNKFCRESASVPPYSAGNVYLILENPPCMHFPGFQEIVDLKYLVYYNFLMLDNSHIGFGPEI